MEKSISKTDLVRKQIADYLKMQNGDWVRQKDIINKLLPSNPYNAEIGVYRGIFNKIAGIGGIFIPIPNVEMKKDGGKAFYRYIEPDPIKFINNNSLNSIASHLQNFEKVLKEEQLFNVDLRKFNRAEVDAYLQFVRQFEDLKMIFFEEN